MQGWAVLFNDKRFKDQDSLKETAKGYAQVFRGERWTVRRFERASSHAVKSSKFYPKVADIMAADRELGNREQYSNESEPDKPTEMSEVHRIFFGIGGRLRNGKSPVDDYPEYGPSLDELKKMSPEEVGADFHRRHPDYASLIGKY